MRSWMIGVISGIMPVSVWASLPGATTALAMLVAGLLLTVLNRGNGYRYLAGLTLGFGVAIIHGHLLLDRRPAQDCEFKRIQIEGVVSSLPQVQTRRDGGLRQRFEFEVHRTDPDHCSGPRTVLLSYYGSTEINPGERWRFQVALKRPWGVANPGAFNVQSWFAQAGIDATGNVGESRLTLLATATGLRTQHHRLRRTISDRLSLLPVSADSISVLRALTVADKSGMDEQLWRLFQQYGLNHLLVISGLHIGLLAGLGLVMGRGLGRVGLLLGYHRPMQFAPGLLALSLAALYTALAGFSLATNRALIMLVVFVFASMAGRSSGSWNNLLIAGFLLLVINPLAVLGSGFWLSFSAVAWLLWLGIWQSGTGRVRQLAKTHIAMSLIMLPLGGWWFGGASPVAAAANFLMVPLVGTVVVPLALLGVAVGSVHSDWGEQLLCLAAWPLERLIPTAGEFAQGVDGGLFWHFSPSWSAGALAIGGLSLLVIRPQLPTLALALMLCLPLMLPASVIGWKARYLAKLTVLDVGQGTAIVFQDRERVLIYDTGGGDPAGFNMAKAVIMPYLRREGVESVDTLVVSHGDNDHSAGVATLLSQIPVHRYFRGGEGVAGGRHRSCRAGQAWQWASGIEFQILSPATESGLSRNNASCVLQVRVGGLSLMLPGDVDSGRESALVTYWREGLRSDWLLAAHHGSNTSTSRLWLKYVQPHTVVFSSGYGNAFGHPHPTVLGRTAEIGRTLHTTSATGAIELYIRADGTVKVTQYRPEHRRYWM